MGTPMLQPDKGLRNGSCNRTACQAPGATWYNLSTRAWYCGECAGMINWAGGRKDTQRLFGTDLLCTQDPALIPADI